MYRGIMNYTQIICVALAGTLLSSAATPKKNFFRQSRSINQPKQIGGTAVVNAASYLPGVSPGGLATVFGTNLTDVNGVVVAGTNPLPLVLADVSVSVNGVPAAMFSVSYANGQDVISFQVPWETATGPGAVEVQVYDYGILVADEVVDSFTEDPGIFEYQLYGTTYAVAAHTDGNVIGPDDPASRGEVIVLYTTGLGPVDQPVPDGYAAPFNPLANTEEPFAVTIAGENGRVLFSGLAPGFVGLYQINLVLPGDLPAGDLPISITSPYANSQTVLLTVR
jgi:uncharacterized protein (TIGR03437 family)